MRHVMTRALLATLLLGSAGAAMQRSAHAAGYDGTWSVLIVTETGTCDRGYRYNVNVSNGQVRYQGDAAAVNLTGTVTPAGLVKVSIKVGDQGADGTGHLIGEQRRRNLAWRRRERHRLRRSLGSRAAIASARPIISLEDRRPISVIMR